MLVVRRPVESGPEYLVVLRSPEKLGYWHLVAGGVDWDEEPAAAAARELLEETGLVARVVPLGETLDYDLSGDPESVRERFPAGTERILVWPFVADAPAGWEPTLDDEHVEARWLGADQAIALLFYPEPREAVRGPRHEGWDRHDAAPPDPGRDGTALSSAYSGLSPDDPASSWWGSRRAAPGGSPRSDGTGSGTRSGSDAPRPGSTCCTARRSALRSPRARRSS